MKKVLLILVFFLAHTLVYTQSERYFGWKRVSVAQNLKADKIVVLTHEMSTFYFSFYRYKAYFLKDMDEDSDLMRGIELLNEMESEMKNDTLYLNSFKSRHPVPGITKNFLYRSIKSRNVRIFNHNTQSFARKLIRKRYVFICGSRCGSRGFRYFFAKDSFIVFEWAKAIF